MYAIHRKLIDWQVTRSSGGSESKKIDWLPAVSPGIIE